MKTLRKFVDYCDLVKISHTLFALPFALGVFFLAYFSQDNLGNVDWSLFIWVVIAFTSARASAMGFNRLVDIDFDKLNPRTKNRPSANGKISKHSMKFFITLSVLIFIFSAYMINSLCFVLSFPALFVLLGYSYAKRFTAFAHYILGFALSLAPIGAWIAVKNSFDFGVVFLSVSIFFNIAAFDIIYAFADEEFDKKQLLNSIPSKFGKKNSLSFIAVSFIASIISLFYFGFSFGLNTFYELCVATIGIIYAYILIKLKKNDVCKFNDLFFWSNIMVSFLIFMGLMVNIFVYE